MTFYGLSQMGASNTYGIVPWDPNIIRPSWECASVFACNFCQDRLSGEAIKLLQRGDSEQVGVNRTPSVL